MSQTKKITSNIVQINNFPQLTPRLKKRVLVGVRPFRKGGIKLELDKINNKNIIYNYGHGGAGVSIAPACGVESAELAAKAVGPNKNVSVIGSGIIGLFTALACADKGLNITIYADRIPKPNQKDVLNMCTSQIAPGYWLPFNYEFSDLAQHKKRTQLSWKIYNEWVKKSANIYEVDCFQQMKPQLFRQSSPEFIIQTSRNVIIKLGNKQFDVIHFKTLQLHLQRFLQDLIAQCLKKGIKFETKKFNNLKDITSVKDDVIVACLGLNSKFIFNDDNVYGIKGHLVELQNTSGHPLVYGFQFQGEFGMYCFQDKVLIGLSRENSDEVTINEKTVKMLEERAYSFYKHVGLDAKPKL